MKPEDIEVGGVYENKEGLQRKVRDIVPSFDWNGPLVWWVKVAGPKGRRLEDRCRISSFARWAARRVQPPGEVQP